ncbi:MAG: amidohydrolase family protein [Bryobacterales bacterium]|nr:amidohydrolase family protein [Bryobacterales bacterium]
MAATRREFLMAMAVTRPKGLLIDTHTHLFDEKRFAYHKSAVYKPAAQPLEAYAKFVEEAKIDHTVIVHPEPYQDDHAYLEYCFRNEPRKGFFKGTCLFDATDPGTPRRMAELMRRNAGRIVALRVHINRKPGVPATVAGAIRDRDLRHPQMKKTWAAAGEMRLAIQMHCIPHWAKQIGELAAANAGVTVVLDHLARAGEGTAAEYEDVLALARLPRVYMKFSGWRYSSKQGHPYLDAKPLVRRTYEAFGADRMIWGGLGHNMEEFGKAVEVFEKMFDFVGERERGKIRGVTAARVFGFGAG